MTNLIGQVVTIVKKPLLPQMVHDDTTRTIISIIGLILVSFTLYHIGRYYGR